MNIKILINILSAILIYISINHNLYAAKQHQQLLLVKSIAQSKGIMYVYDIFHEDRVLRKTIPVVLGKNGVISPKEKIEGDGYTPKGLYNLSKVFGQVNIKINMPYILLDKNHKWVDDPKSNQYNQLVHGKTSAKTFENMYIPEYILGIVIGYNINPVITNKGSAIFIHVWRSSNTPTSGCIAMSRKNIFWLVNWLNYRSSPQIRVI